MKAVLEWDAKEYRLGQRATLKITVINDSKYPILVQGSTVVFCKVNKKLKETHTQSIEPGKPMVVWETLVTIGPWAEKAGATSTLCITYKTKKGASWSGQKSRRFPQGSALTITDASATGHKIFISHSNRDRDKTIVEETARIVRKLGFEAYVSENDHSLGDNLWKNILREVLGCNGLIFLLTKDGVESCDMREELGYARASNATSENKTAKIVPIVEKGVEPAGSLKGEKYEEIDMGRPSTVPDRIAEIVTDSFVRDSKT